MSEHSTVFQIQAHRPINLKAASSFLPSDVSRILLVSVQNYIPVMMKFSDLFFKSWINHVSSSCYELRAAYIFMMAPSIHHFHTSTCFLRSPCPCLNFDCPQSGFMTILVCNFSHNWYLKPVSSWFICHLEKYFCIALVNSDGFCWP